MAARSNTRSGEEAIKAHEALLYQLSFRAKSRNPAARSRDKSTGSFDSASLPSG
jgi:hypothetical protein